MKSIQLTFIYLVVILQFVSCQMQEANSTVIGLGSNENTRNYLEIISSLGYSADVIEETETYFILSGETIIYKSELDEFENNSPVTKANSAIRLPNELQHIYIIDSYISNDYVPLLQSAVDEWNNLPDCNIRFSTIFDETPHPEWDHHVYLEISDNPQLLTESSAMIRDSIDPCLIFTVSVNTSHECWQALSEEQRKYALMHALGHLAGLKDSDETNYHVSQTYRDDVFSIMLPSDEINEGNIANYWQGFSDYDIYNFSYMYPALPSNISVDMPEAMVTSNRYTITAEYTSFKEIPNAKFDFSFTFVPDGAADPITNSLTNACVVSFEKPGLYTLQVRLLGGEAQTERFTATYDIFIDGSSFTFPSLCDIKINIPFDVKWSFYKFGISSKISLTGYETLFDNGSDANIEIEEISNGEFKVTLKDYGSYILLIEAKKNDGTVLSQKRIKVNKFYAPKMTMDDSNIDLVNDWDYRVEAFKIGDLCEDVLNISAPHNLVQIPTYSTTLSDNGELEGRLYFRVYRKYFRESFPVGRAAQRRPITDTTFFVDVRRYPSDGIIYTPDFPLYDNHVYYNPPIETELGIASYVKYRGYYGIIIPDSNIEIE